MRTYSSVPLIGLIGYFNQMYFNNLSSNYAIHILYKNAKTYKGIQLALR